MAIFNNLDRIDAAINTKHPFKWESGLTIGNGDIPVREIISVRLYVTESTVPPFRLAGITLNLDDLECTIQDNNGRNCASFTLPLGANATLLHKIHDSYGCIAGHFVCTPVFIKTVAAMVKNAGGAVTTERNDFVFDASCYVPVLSGVFKSIALNGTSYTTDVVIKTGENVMIKVGNDATICASSVSDYQELSADDSFTEIAINGNVVAAPAEGWHLVLSHELASNLRVVTTANTIQLRGVQDV